MFRDTYNYRRKREAPNRLRRMPTLSFRCDLESETLGYLKSLGRGKARSKFINQAIEMKLFYEKYHRRFLIQMIQSNFYFCKHILRQIGSANNEFRNRESNSKGINTKQQEIVKNA